MSQPPEGATAEAPQPATPPTPSIDPRDYLRTIGVAALIGIPAALVAAVFLQVVHLLEQWLWTDLPDAMGREAPPWWLIVLLPIVGALLVAAARAFLPGDGGHQPLAGIGGGAMPLEYGPGIALAALGGLAFGAVIGPEAPLIALGSVVGVAGARMVKAGSASTAMTANAGSFSAVSAVFGGPIVASMLMLESGAALGSALVPALLPGLASASVGYLIFEGLGHWSGLQAASLDVPNLPAYVDVRWVDIVSALVVGLVTAIVISVVRVLARRVDTQRRVHRSPWVPLLIGGAAIGVLAVVAQALGADYSEILFSGQSAVPAVVAETSVGVLLVIVLAKGLGYAISLGAGFRGGPVFPAVTLGVALATIPVVLFDASPTAAIGIGCAAGMAAMPKLPFSGLLFGTLLVGTGNVAVVPVSGMAAVVAWVAAMALMKRLEPVPFVAEAPARSRAAGPAGG